MYMAPITRAEARPASPPPASPPPASLALRRSVGVAVLLAAMPVMAAWLLVHALVAAVVLGTRAGLQTIDYAGTVALGR